MLYRLLHSAVVLSSLSLRVFDDIPPPAAAAAAGGVGRGESLLSGR
jgi:hypothetical protein